MADVGTTTTIPAPAHRLTAAEARQPIAGILCGTCGREDATLYPWEERGIVACPTCSPSWLIRWMRDWAERVFGVPA
jgi:hypothetical protein